VHEAYALFSTPLVETDCGREEQGASIHESPRRSILGNRSFGPTR
jgi:hypothetical protein